MIKVNNMKSKEWLSKNGYDNAQFWTKDHVEIVMDQFCNSELTNLSTKIDKLKSALRILEQSNRPPSMKSINEILK
jgi:hypothetical protein